MTGLSTASRICGLQSCSWASAIFLCVPIWAWALGVLFQVSAAPAAALPQSPSQPHSLRGRTQGLRHRGERSTAPIEHEGQSFLSNNIASWRNGRSDQRFESHPFRHIALILKHYLGRTTHNPRLYPRSATLGNAQIEARRASLTPPLPDQCELNARIADGHSAPPQSLHRLILRGVNVTGICITAD